MRIMLIGGRSIEPDNYKIEERMISFYKNPNVLIFPTASSDSDKSINNLKNLFNNINCKYDFALLFSDDINNIITKMDNADILYFAGGNTDVLVNKIIELKLDDYLRKTSKMLVGISAGAIMLSLAGLGDSYSYHDNNHIYNCKMVKGLGILDIIFCPHYEQDDLVIFNDIVKEYDKDAYALECDTAIIFDDNKLEVVKSDNRRGAYAFKREMNYIMESIKNTLEVAVLGPEGTYCDLAAKEYISSQDRDIKINYYPSIIKTINAIKDNDLAILPFENSLDGYVYDTIDNLVKYNYSIIGTVLEKIDFVFVSNAESLSDVKHVYAQFKAKAECLDFLSDKEFNIITTESNMISLEKLKASDNTYGAIIPAHKLTDNYNIVLKDIADSDNNYTRFAVVYKNKPLVKFKDSIKASLVISILEDHPGALFNALRVFNDYNMNLNAILSRPTKEGLGKYAFYIEISVNEDKVSDLKKCIDIISSDKNYIVNNLGIYSE